MIRNMFFASLVLATASLGLGQAAAEPDISRPQTAEVDRWAVVKKDGALVSGRGVVSVIRGAPLVPVGLYKITFDKDVTPCAYVATLSSPGLVSVKSGLGDTHSVIVYTRDLDTDRADRGFSLHLTCTPNVPFSMGNPWTVVRDNGSYARGKGVLSTIRTSTGRYEVTFDEDIGLCIPVATLGLPGAAGAEQRGIVSVSPGETPRKLNVDVFSEARFEADRGFHLSVACDLTRRDRFAEIDHTNVLVGGEGKVELIDANGKGKYLLQFDRNVSKCAFAATTGFIGGPGGTIDGHLKAGPISVLPVKGNSKRRAASPRRR
jgi:hypothetical protein